MKTLLLLLFRARTPQEIADPNCPVDCWVLPRNNPQGTPLRYALYRLLLQGFRRFQGFYTYIPSLTLHGARPFNRLFFSGVPVWDVDNQVREHPHYKRQIDVNTGAFYWVRKEDLSPLQDTNGGLIWDTFAVW